MLHRRRYLHLVLTAVLLSNSSAADAEILRFVATLSANDAVPAAVSRGTGQAEFQYDTERKQLTFAIVYQDLRGAVTAGHIHGPADAGGIAEAIVGFGVPESPINGTSSLTREQAADLVNGRLYVDIHTTAFPSGEIRGQIHP